MCGVTFSVRPAERHPDDPRPQPLSLGIHASLAWVRLYSKTFSVVACGGFDDVCDFECNSAVLLL